MIEKIKYAIFDMDGTIINSLIIWDIIWENFGKKYLNDPSFRPDSEVDKAIRTMTLLGAMEYFHGIYKMGENSDELYEYSTGIISDFYKNDVLPKKGAIEFLEELHKRGIKMCIASATDMKLIRMAMEKCALNKYFEHVISCGDIGKGKDEPDVFLAALSSIGGDLSSACVFEDSLLAVKTAKKAGFMTIGIFDKDNFGQDELKLTADRYISEGETLLKLFEE